MRPSVPTSQPALGVAKATAQNPVTSGSGYQVVPSSGVQAAPPSFAVITTARPRLFLPPRPVRPTYLSPKIAPVTGGGLAKVQVLPPSLETAVRASLGLPGSRSPPPTIPLCGSRKSTVNAPALGPLNNGVSYAFQVSPWSVVARILATSATPVAIQAFRPPCVVTLVPLDAKEPSPGKAGGMLPLMSCHVIPLSVRKSWNTPLTESPCKIPRRGVQNANPS